MNNILKKFKRFRIDININIEELNNIIKINKESILVDVRSPLEYSEGHLNRSYKYTII